MARLNVFLDEQVYDLFRIECIRHHTTISERIRALIEVQIRLWNEENATPEETPEPSQQS